jgi:hypothetical protein
MKIMIEKSCFLFVLNKKTNQDLLTAKQFDLKNSKFHFIDNYESKIAQTNVWFIKRMIISQKRQ